MKTVRGSSPDTRVTAAGTGSESIPPDSQTQEKLIEAAVSALYAVAGYTDAQRAQGYGAGIRPFVVGLSRWRLQDPQALRSFTSEVAEVAKRYPDVEAAAQADGAR